MRKDRLEELLYNAVLIHERDLQSFHDDTEAHEILLEDIGITEQEYRQLLKRVEERNR